MSHYHNKTDFIFSHTATEFSPKVKNKEESDTFNTEDINVDIIEKQIESNDINEQ
jgi:hypothetical protein